jgi:methionine-rich copper-binding protein CopC
VNGESGATIEYSLDGGTTWLAYSAAVTLTNEGSYTITARQRSDAAGNWSVNATYITVVINQATDTTAPTVTFSPANGANGVAISDNITITFSEAVQNVDNSVLTDSNIDSHITLKLNNASGSNISFNATINTEKTVITINPTSNLTNSQAVYVAIGATLEDYTDNPITAANASFTTESSTDSTLIAHYAFEGNLNDNSSYNRHLTEAQGSQITYSDINSQYNKSGQAALFNGTNTHAYTNNISIADSDNWTISFWTKPDSSNMSQWDSVMSTGDTNTTSGGIFQIDYTGNNQLRFNTSGILLDLTLADGEWQHFVFTKSYTPCGFHLYNHQITYFKDGEIIGNKTRVETSWDKIKIGLNRLDDSYWKGHIDDLRIYNRTLTTHEVKELFESYE